jgi:hypothetical protein
MDLATHYLGPIGLNFDLCQFFEATPHRLFDTAFRRPVI